MPVARISFHSQTPPTRGQIGMFVAAFRAELVHSGWTLPNWFRKTTAAFAQLFGCSAAMIVHGARHEYYVNHADFSHGQFLPREAMGTEHLGWDRFDKLFAEELQDPGTPIRAIEIPSIRGDRIRVFDAEGQVVERLVSSDLIEDFVIDRQRQAVGSLMLIPIVRREQENGRRAMAYLYSPHTDHFRLPMAGFAAIRLARASAPVIGSLLG